MQEGRDWQIGMQITIFILQYHATQNNPFFSACDARSRRRLYRQPPKPPIHQPAVAVSSAFGLREVWSRRWRSEAPPACRRVWVCHLAVDAQIMLPPDCLRRSAGGGV